MKELPQDDFALSSLRYLPTFQYSLISSAFTLRNAFCRAYTIMSTIFPAYGIISPIIISPDLCNQFFFGFRPGFPGTVRVGLTASSGIAHIVPNLTAPSIFPALHNICICLTETFHLSAISSGRIYPFTISTSLKRKYSCLYYYIRVCVFCLVKLYKKLFNSIRSRCRLFHIAVANDNFILNITTAADIIYTAGNRPAQKENNIHLLVLAVIWFADTI